MRDLSFCRASMSTVVLATCVGLAACNVRFHADFESDVPGNPPAANPAGAADDEILILNSNVPADGIVIRVTDESDLVPAGQAHRFMSLIREPDPGMSSIASLRSAPMATGSQSLFVQWEQILDGGGTGLITLFGLPADSPSDPETCRVTTGNDVITLECGSSAEQIGDIDTHAVHTVLVRIDRPARRAALQVAQAGSTTPLVTVQSGEVPAPIEGQRFVAQIEYQGQSNSAYRFNRFDIQERDPN
jgi:hypothetical protein